MPNWKKVIVSGSDASLNSITTPAGTINNITASNAITASYALNGGVTQLLAGPNITLSPTNGLGQVTVSSTGGSGPFFNTATGSYGSFYDTTIQTNPVANIARSMSFNSTDITNGVSISGSTSPFNTYIKTENAGIYNIQFSAQVEKTDSGTDEIVVWLRKNGIDLTDSATKLTLSGNGTKVVAAWNWFALSAANDYYQIIWVSADTGMRLYAEPINSTPGIPSVILTVNRVDQFLSNTGSFSGSFTGTLTGTASYATQALTASNALTASYTPSIAGTDNYIPKFNGSSALENSVMYETGSNIGIGTTSPAYKLDVIGKIALNDGGNSVLIGTNAGLLDNGTNNSNVAVGVSASQNNTNGTNNVAIGINALFANTVSNNTAIGTNALSLNTTGTPNTAVGSFSQVSSSTGTFNTSLGTNTLSNNTVGSLHTALGASVLFSLFTGSSNSAVGSAALFSLITGSENNALGRNAGRYYGATGTLANTDASASIFIGFNSRANNIGQTNQVVIGNEALGLGSNTVVIGNDNITTTSLKGNVGIGTTTPNAKLDVNGNTIITGSLTVTGGITGSIASSSFALTASYVNPLNQTVEITGSLQVQDSIDSSLRFLIDSLGTASLDWEDGYLYNGSGSISVDWRDKKLYDSNVDNSVNWNTRQLFKSDGTTVTLDWETGAFTGSLLGTASNATQALSASYALTASFINVTGSNAFIQGGNSFGTDALLGTNDNQSLSFETSGSVRMFISSSGNVGIGISTPQQRLTLPGNNLIMFTGVSAQNMPSYVGTDSSDNFYAYSGGQGSGKTSFFGPSNGTHIRTFASFLDLYTGNGAPVLGLRVVTATNNILIGTTTDSARLTVRGSGATSATTALLVQNSNASASLSVLDNGNVGIGTAVPAYSLDVRSGDLFVTGSRVAYFNNIRPADNSGTISFNNFGGTLAGRMFLDGSIWRFKSSTSVDTLNIFSNGNLGIRQTSDFGFALDVAGSGRFTGNVGIGRTPTSSLDIAGTTRISGSFNTAVSGSILTVQGSGSAQPIFTVQGSQGELFSVTDSLSGSLFSVNDISGLPILEVFSDNTTLIGNYQDPMLITTTKLVTTASGAFTLYSLPTASYDTAFFEYSIKSGSNARAGTIMAIQLGSSVNFTETTTTDFGSTSGFGFTVQVAGANMRLTGSATTSGWTIKTIVRGI